MLASLNQMSYKFTNRQDDVISLCYMIFYMLNNSELPGFDSFLKTKNFDANTDIQQCFEIVKRYKNDVTLTKMSKMISLDFKGNQKKLNNMKVNDLIEQIKQILACFAREV